MQVPRFGGEMCMPRFTYNFAPSPRNNFWSDWPFNYLLSKLYIYIYIGQARYVEQNMPIPNWCLLKWKNNEKYMATINISMVHAPVQFLHIFTYPPGTPNGKFYQTPAGGRGCLGRYKASCCAPLLGGSSHWKYAVNNPWWYMVIEIVPELEKKSASFHGRTPWLEKMGDPNSIRTKWGESCSKWGPFLSRFRRPFSNPTQRRETAENHLKASECLKIFSEDIEQTRSKNNTSMYG